MIFRIPTHRINWTTSSFLIGTFVLTLTAVPLYLWYFGIDWFQVGLFIILLLAAAFSITLGYHRLFSHQTFRTKLPVRLFTLIFGAAAFENSVLMWASEHRRHHKHVDHDEDPYDISKGFFHAHIGWLLFKLQPQPPFDNVADLKKDPLVMWQHRHVHVIAVLVGFVLPTLLGFAWNGWSGALGGFLIGGVTKIVALQHGTFLINSACHTIGRQPYSRRCSARDSFLMALFTFGEGYHNYHHEFQHDYRNGVKPWEWDPTKWLIWTLSKLGLAGGLRRVPRETILLAQARNGGYCKNTISGTTLVPENKEIPSEIESRLASPMGELYEEMSTRPIVTLSRNTKPQNVAQHFFAGLRNATGDQPAKCAAEGDGLGSDSYSATVTVNEWVQQTSRPSV